MLNYVALFSLTIATAAAFAADFDKEIEQAIAKHEAEVSSIKLRMAKELRIQIKDAANREELSELRSLLDAHDGFVKSSTLPKVAGLEEAIKVYTRDRKASAYSVVLVFRKAQDDAVNNLMVSKADTIQKRLNQFLNAERVAIGLPSQEESTFGDVDTEATAKPETLEDYLADFIERLDTAMKEVNEFPTKAQQDEEFRKHIKKFDAELQRKFMTFEFPIENVSETRKGYELDFGEPKQLAGIRYVNRSGGLVEKLKKSDALEIDNKSRYVFSGNGRLYAGDNESTIPSGTAKVVRIFAFQVPSTSNVFAIFLEGTKTKLIK